MRKPETSPERLARLTNADQRAVRAGEAISFLTRQIADLKEIRKQAVLELSAEGYTYEQIAEMLSITKGRAYQIANGQSGSTAKYYS